MGVSVGIGTMDVSVGVGRITVIVIVGITGVFVRRIATSLVMLCISSCAYAFGDKKSTIPTNTKSKRVQKSALPLCNADSCCPALFRARTYTYF